MPYRYPTKVLRASASALVAFFALCASATASRPNVLFIMSDDHTTQAIGAYGGRLEHLNLTPTLDRLASEGMLMENAFGQNALCTPSRAIIMTGQSSAVNGCPTLGSTLAPEKQYLSIEMKKAGYDTAVIGKWHLKKLPLSFDYYKVLPGQGNYFNPVFLETGATGEYPGKKNKILKGAVKMKGHSTDCITDSALEWFKTKRDTEKPFFLKLHFKAPHDKFEYARRYEKFLADIDIPEPDNMRDRKNHGSIATRGHNDELVPYIGTSIGRRNPRRNYTTDGAWTKKIDLTQSEDKIHGDAYQYYMKAYLRCVKGVDDNIKRVVDYLKAEGLYDNTIIIYTSDQGFYLGEHDYRDKRWPYDESMRMPLIIRYPATISAGRSDAIVENLDFAPTMLDYAGVKTPKYMQGRSFKNVLEEGAEGRESAYYHYWQHMSGHDNPACVAIRTKRHKLIFYYGASIKSNKASTPPGWELYDLKLDPTEDNNVYDNPEYAGIIADLKVQLKERRSELKEDSSKFKFNAVIDDFGEYDEADRKEAIKISAKYLKSKKDAKR